MDYRELSRIASWAAVELDSRRLRKQDKREYTSQLVERVTKLSNMGSSASVEEQFFMGRVVSRHFFGVPIAKIKMTEVYDKFKEITDELAQYKVDCAEKIAKIRDICISIGNAALYHNEMPARRFAFA